jgi:D-3-phosphoglycerate dehydrogenase / 2-oxoglutarate reductase
MKKIIVTDAVDKKCIPIFEKAGFEVNYKPGMPLDEIKKVIGDYDALIVRSETKATPELIALMKNMKVIGRAGTGVDNVDIDAATRKGIIVMNTPGGNTISTAEHTMALMLSMCRNTAQANQSLRSGKWERKLFKGTEVHGKTLGIIGLGKIGREVAIRAQGFGMIPIGYDPLLGPEVSSKLGIEVVDLDTLYSRADIITVHVPLTAQTENMINDESIKKCKDGVRFINCARGGIIEEAALVRALESGKVAGAAFDVYVKEPPEKDSPLVSNPKVVCTPHLGASTEEAQEKVAVQIAEQIVDLFNSDIAKGAVNAAAIQASGNKEILPYVELAESLGAMHAQLIQGKLLSININYSGENLHSSATLLSTATLKGFLSKKIAEQVNLINAPFLAKEMGIVLNETKSGSNVNYKSLISVEFVSENGKRLLAGTVFGNNEIRIEYIDKFHLELRPEGNMIFYSNTDKPGMLAKVGSILAEAKINIAGLSLGRLDVGKEALTVINVDDNVDKKVVEAISSIEGIHNVYSVKI